MDDSITLMNSRGVSPEHGIEARNLWASLLGPQFLSHSDAPDRLATRDSDMNDNTSKEPVLRNVASDQPSARGITPEQLIALASLTRRSSIRVLWIG